ncbi:MAG: YfcC family protein, partial [Oscillibacter sp.]|nr:YfcC family protein [Oscillibacter sp.]
GLIDRMKESEIAEVFVAGCADLLGVALIIGISRGITVIMNDGAVTDPILNWGEQALAGAGPVMFVVLVYFIYLPLSVLIPSSSGLATLSIPIVAPLGRFAGVGGELVVTAFQSASGLVNIITPTAAVVMGALALGKVGYDQWFRYVWKLIVYFCALTVLFLAVGAVLGG